MKKMIAILLALATVCSFAVTSFAAEDKTTTKTYQDKNGGTITEVYDEDGVLIHKEEPYYKNGKRSGTKCYDSFILCDYTDKTYSSPLSWSLPILAPEEPIKKCLSFNLNVIIFSIDKEKNLGTQRIYYRIDDVFQNAGYLDVDELETSYSMKCKFDNPVKVDGFAMMPYTPVGSYSSYEVIYLTDVVYLK